ncbi:MarR family winged helix-turn-helix transcriptional regulator [Hymenobacter terrenus]|uniref:MarR family winged helix-turn-helix transcriptional regulator n=1 Tax=Hymenobacter terrenus TaxID=1629124 RepID=UPI000619F9E5|nr:MarR family transcriptional regulator [Hymenobacter terrenus]
MKAKAAGLGSCNCLSLRQAARHVSQFYDQQLAPFGLTLNQYTILVRLAVLGAAPITAVAQDLVMDRTTLTRNLKPLQAAGLLTQKPSDSDRRSQYLSLTSRGEHVFALATPAWAAAQARYEQEVGAGQAAALRQLLHNVVQTPLLG